jgi:iron-sulfur cluster repair protein YtfE (RIC family)
MVDEIVMTPLWTLNEVVRVYPTTLAVLERFGVAGCCGGTRTLVDVATRHRVDLAMLLDALERAAGGEGAVRS